MRIPSRSLRVLAWVIGGLLVPAVIWAAVGGPVYTKSENGTAFTNQLGKNAAAGRVLKIPSTSTDTSAAVWEPESSSLPSGTPGQVPTISAVTATGTVTATATQTSTGTATAVTVTLTSTGTVTTTATEYAAAPPPFDFAGVYFVGSAPSEGSLPGPGDASTGRWMRWRTMRDYGSLQYLTYAGTCSSGSDALIMTMTDNGAYWGAATAYDQRDIWPAGNWLAALRAKVSANGAAIRVETWRDAYYGDEYDAQLFNWTTDVFANTDFAAISKMTVQPEFVPLSSNDRIMFKLYATCSASTTVTVEVGTKTNGWASRIYSPFAVDRLHANDIAYYGATGSVGAELFYLSNLLDGAIEDIAAKEPIISGVPGQFVKFAGTGTSVTTSKEAATVGVATRSFTLSASDFTLAGNSANFTSTSAIPYWYFHHDAGYYAAGAILHIPADYASGLAVSPIWLSTVTGDTNSTHRTVWNLAYKRLYTGSTVNAANLWSAISWSGDQCSSLSCSGAAINVESAHSISSMSGLAAGQSYSIYFQRLGTDSADTYTSETQFVGLRFTYTPTL